MLATNMLELASKSHVIPTLWLTRSIHSNGIEDFSQFSQFVKWIQLLTENTSMEH